MADKKSTKPKEQKTAEPAQKPKDIGIPIVPTVGGSKTARSRSATQIITEKMGEAVLETFRQKQESLEIQQEKDRKKRFIAVMEDLSTIKKETLANQETISDLKHQLELKKIESRHRSSRLTQTFMVILWLSFLLSASLYVALQPDDLAQADRAKNTPIISPEEPEPIVVEESPMIEREQREIAPTGNSHHQNEMTQNESVPASTLEAHGMQDDGPIVTADKSGGQNEPPVPTEEQDIEKQQVEPENIEQQNSVSEVPPVASDNDTNTQQVVDQGIEGGDAYLQYLQNLYEKTFKLHEVAIEAASNIMEQNEKNMQSQKLRTTTVVKRDQDDIKHLKVSIFYHLDEVLALQLKAAEASSHGSMIVSSADKRWQRSPQGIATVKRIHEELVNLGGAGDGGELPVMSGQTYYSPAKPMGLQKILLAFKKFKRFSTRDQYKQLEAAITDFKAAFKVERTDYVKSSFDMVSAFYSSSMTSLSTFYKSRVQQGSA